MDIVILLVVGLLVGTIWSAICRLVEELRTPLRFLIAGIVPPLAVAASGINGATLSIITGSVLTTLAVTAWMLRRRFR